MNEQYFSYGEKEIEYLKRKDRKLAAVIDQLGHPQRRVIPDLFQAIVNSILGQQVSTKAADTIWDRFLAMFSPVTPEHMLAVSREKLQQCGTTFRKIDYIQGIAGEIASGQLDLEEIAHLPDEEFCETLSRLPGIGRWTAEMLLIHCLQRPDVLSYGDLAILRGLRMVYRHRKITREQFRRYQKRYSPYGSVASIYLWAVSAGTIPGLTDPGETGKKEKRKASRKIRDKASSEK